MDWIDNYQLFLFDFDGLLVKTELIHYQAYINTLSRRGFNLDWNFNEFCQNAHFESEGLEESIYAKFPDLKEMEPSWKVIYEEKKKNYLDLLKSGPVELMPGVEDLINRLAKAEKKICVVTNSLKEQTDMVIGKVPVLKKISHWITREDYQFPKPSPECYLRAIELFRTRGDSYIGFEDTVKGLKALLNTPAQAVLISETTSPQLQAIESQSFIHYKSFEEIPEGRI